MTLMMNFWIVFLQLSSSELVSGVPATAAWRPDTPPTAPELTPWPLGLGPRDRRPFLTSSALRSDRTIFGDDVSDRMVVGVLEVAVFLLNGT